MIVHGTLANFFIYFILYNNMNFFEAPYSPAKMEENKSILIQRNILPIKKIIKIYGNRVIKNDNNIIKIIRNKKIN